MQNVAVDIWPYVLSALLSAVAMYIGYIHQLKLEVAVLKATVEDQAKAIENITKRMDSHSRKQDDILSTITELKVELVKQIGNMSTELGSLSSDVKNINRALSVYDNGVTFNKP